MSSKSFKSSKLYVRGLISNGLGAAILWGVSKLDLGFYVMVSASIQCTQMKVINIIVKARHALYTDKIHRSDLQ
jgi:hypothetical protein